MNIKDLSHLLNVFLPERLGKYNLMARKKILELTSKSLNQMETGRVLIKIDENISILGKNYAFHLSFIGSCLTF